MLFLLLLLLLLLFLQQREAGGSASVRHPAYVQVCELARQRVVKGCAESATWTPFEATSTHAVDTYRTAVALSTTSLRISVTMQRSEGHDSESLADAQASPTSCRWPKDVEEDSLSGQRGEGQLFFLWQVVQQQAKDVRAENCMPAMNTFPMS